MTTKPLVLRHCGDIGDLLAALCILRIRGGGAVHVYHDSDARPGLRPRESLEGARYAALKPLLEAQPYVTEVKWIGEINTAEAGFRETMRPRNESLLERQARHTGDWPIDQSPWLVAPGFEPHDRVIAARSPRYHNPDGFPWREMAATYGDRLLFVGLKPEHEAFEAAVGRRVEHAKTENFLDIARLIAGSRFPSYFNQSSPLWVALGLGARVVVEGEPRFPNSELYTHPNNVYAYGAEDMHRIRGALRNVKS